MKTTFKIIKDTEWDEYQVQVFENGILNEKRTYFTDDHDDAKLTMAEMKKEEKGEKMKTIKIELTKIGINQEKIKAILSGYEGAENKIADNFFATDILFKTVMVFDKKYPAWDKGLLELTSQDVKRIKTLLNKIKQI